jgi:tetratricopeptide (TPR) repeat protein
MRYLRETTAFVGILFLLATSAFAETESEKAYREAKAAYWSGKYEEAWEGALRASQTDPKNPEVLLLLGQTQYRLGHPEDAIESWKKSLALAPQDILATQMLAMLHAQQASVAERTKLVELLLSERLFVPALTETEKCLAEKTITSDARAQLLVLRAEALIRQGETTESQKLLNETLVLYPQQADRAKISFLTGLAKLSKTETAVEGLAILKKLAAEQPETPLGKTAQYEAASFALEQESSSANIEALAKWLKDNPQHPRVSDAKRLLITSNLKYARRVAQPTAESKLNDYDLKALALAAESLSAAVRADKRIAIAQPIVEHLENYYANSGAHAAAVTGLETLLKSPLEDESRLKVLQLIANSKYALAIRWLKEHELTGDLPDGSSPTELPNELKAVRDALDAVRKQNPSQPVWQKQIELALAAQALAKSVPWPEKITKPRGPEAWAIELAEHSIARDGANQAALEAGVAAIRKTVGEFPHGPQNREVRDLPLSITRELILLVGRYRSSPVWADTMRWHCELLSKAAQREFGENIKAGKSSENAKLSELQKELLKNLQSFDASNATDYARTFTLAHLQPWREAGHWALIEESLKQIASTPLATFSERLRIDLDIVHLWIDQADRNRNKQRDSGIDLPKELDPLHKKAMVRLYELQADLADDSPMLGEIRKPWWKIVTQYQIQGNMETAIAASQVKGEKAVPLADENAEYALLCLRTAEAKLKFEKYVKQYHGSEELQLLPEHKIVLDGWKKFIAAHPASSLVPSVNVPVTGVAQLYEQQNAFLVSAGIYADFGKFAREQKTLSQHVDDRTSVADFAQFAEAAALGGHAHKMLNRWVAERKPDTAPPDKLSPEFQAAITAYMQVIEANGNGHLAGEAVNRIMGVAAEYARQNAWDVADGIYAQLLNSKLKLNHPERLEFAQGVCRLGAAMPDHAKQVLSALSILDRDAAIHGGEKPDAETTPAENKTEIARNDFIAELDDPFSGELADRKPNGGVGGYDTRTPASSVNGPGLLTDKIAADEVKRDTQLLAMVNQEEKARAHRVAQLRESSARNRNIAQAPANQPQMTQNAVPSMPVPQPTLMTEAELVRQEKAIAAAFDIFTSIRKKYPQTITAEQSRSEILLMAVHWREYSEWKRAGALMTRFLADNPSDPQLPILRFEIAKDLLCYAARPVERRNPRQEMLAEVEKRFGEARAELTKLAADFAKEKDLPQNAQWELAMSYLSQARAIDAVSPTIAGGQFVRSAKELRRVAAQYADHPRLQEIPQILWSIGGELDARDYSEAAIDVWTELVRFDPSHALAGESLMRIAQTYQFKLKRPLRAAEAYQELNFIRGGGDLGLQNTILQIGIQLKNERRWVESLHVLESFVDSFPRHPEAVQALTMIGQIHQTNEAWPEAMTAYCRVIDEYPAGPWVQESRWSIAECTINLSKWKEAADYYRAFIAAYPQDGKVGEANRRIDILKDLERYQSLIDEKDVQRKAFDAQFQIGEIVRKQLNNPVKAIIEYRKVYANWPDSYLAGDSLFAIGETYLSLGELTKARENLKLVAEKYPTSPSASNAMFLVGKSYEDEANKLEKVTRAEQLEQSRDIAQRGAYADAQSNRRANISKGLAKVAQLKAAGKQIKAEIQEAANSSFQNQFDIANVELFAQKAVQQIETMTALELADRQDKVNAALRKAVEAYTATSKISGGSKADSALLQMATIYDQRLKDSKAAMQVWLEIVRQFSGTNVAEDASWKIAQYYEREGKYAEAVDAYQAFLRNYRRSPNAGSAQYAIAENYEHLGQWVKAMDSYANYLTNFADGPLANKAKQQINWIKTYRL